MLDDPHDDARGQESPSIIYTIGHSALSSEEFVALLRQRSIRMVIDVRRFPTSRRNPQFMRETLVSALRIAGVQYAWLGDWLGGFRRGGYEAYVATEHFRQGLSALEASARESATAIMCAEKLPAHCHRRFIADALVRRRWRVLHVLDSTTQYDHTLETRFL